MSSPSQRDSTRDPRRESSDDESVVEHELEEARKNALEANQRYLALQKRSHGKAIPPAPAAEHQQQGAPHREHRAPPPLPAEPRDPAPPPPATSAPVTLAPQPAPNPAAADATPQDRHQEQPSPTPSPPKKRIPAKPLVRDLFGDEEPVESYHNLREQDEEGNFIHSSDEDGDQGAQGGEDPQPSPLQQCQSMRAHTQAHTLTATCYMHADPS